jgi:tetratricopeptide (TPR) repeat protein
MSMSTLARSQMACVAGLVLILLAWLANGVLNDFARRSSASVARELIRAGKFDEAGPALAKWLEWAPDSAEGRFLAARRALALNRLDLGLAELDAASKLGYSRDAIDRERGILFARLGRLSDAEPILRRLFYARAKASPADRALDEALAKCYIENFQLRAAEEVVKRWVLDAPDDPKARYWLADLTRRTTEFDLRSLISDYERVLELDSGYDQARIPLAELYLKAHRNSDAEREYLTYLKRHPEDLEACLGMGQVAATDGRDDLAIDYLNRAMMLAPKDHRPAVERGKLDSRRRRFASALAFFDKAIELDSVDPDIRYQRSVVLSAMGRTDDARKEQEVMSRLRKEKEDLDKLLEGLLRFPADTERQVQAARWFFEHGHPEEGARWAEKILREHPGQVEMNRLLAGHYEKQGKRGLANFYRMQAGGH